MSFHTPPYVDGDTSLANRVTAGWLNWVNVYVNGPRTAATTNLTPVGDVTATDVQGGIQQLDANKAQVSAETAAGTTFVPTGTVTATNVQQAIEQVDAKVIGGGSTAATTTFVPSGNISATNVQAGMEELDVEKAPLSAATAVGTSFAASGGITATNVQAAIQELDTEKAPASAGTATGTSLVPFGTITATNVQTGLQQLDAKIGAGGGTALTTSFTPAGNISATNVQAGMQELDTEKVSLVQLGATTGSSLVGFTQLGTGASNMVVQTKLRQFINIMDYGADNTGVADCTTALNNAIAAAKLYTGTLYVPKGKYLISAGNVVLKDITILGCGVAEKKIPYDDGGSVFLLTNTSTSPFDLQTGVTLDGLCFFYPNQNGVAVNPISYPALFTGTYVTAVSIVNCTITNAFRGFYFYNSATGAIGDVRISDCRIYCIDTTFLFEQGAPEFITINRCLFTFGVYEEVSNVPPYYLRNYSAANGRFIFIDVGASSWPKVEGLSLANNLVFGYRYGIVVRTGSLDEANIASNFFDAVETAFQVDSTGRATSASFKNNWFAGTNVAAPANANPTIVLTGTGAHSQVHFVGNEIQTCQGTFFQCSGADVVDEISFVGNKFHNWGINSSGAAVIYYAIDVADTNAPFDVQIVGNQFRSNYTYGSGIRIATCTAALIEGNQFLTCWVPIGIDTGAANVRIFGNQSTQTQSTSVLSIVPTTPGIVEARMNAWDKAPNRWAFPMVKAVYLSAQTFSGPKTLLNSVLGDQIYDEDNNFASGVFTAPTFGFYSVDICITSNGAGTIGDRWLLTVEQAGGSVYILGAVASVTTAGEFITWAVTGQFKLATGDLLRAYLTRSAGSGTLTLAADANINWISIQKQQ